MKFKEPFYMNQEAAESPLIAWGLDTLERYMEKDGDRVTFAGAGRIGANVSTDSGRYAYINVEGCADVQEAQEKAVMIEVIDGKKVQIKKEDW